MQKVKAWQTTDGKTFTTLPDAQRAEMVSILAPFVFKADEDREALANHLLANCDKVVNVLTLKDGSHPKARKAAGAAPVKRGRKPAVNNAQTEMAPVTGAE